VNKFSLDEVINHGRQYRQKETRAFL